MRAHACMQVLAALSGAAEYDELPVRHNEDALNAGLSQHVRYPGDTRAMDDPHTKASLLLQVRPSLPGSALRPYGHLKRRCVRTVLVPCMLSMAPASSVSARFWQQSEEICVLSTE